MATVVEDDPKAPFSIATKPKCGEGATPFPGLLCFTLDPYLIMLSVKQGSIKYHFLSLWYNSTWNWTQVFRAIVEHSNYWANIKIGLFQHFSFWSWNERNWNIKIHQPFFSKKHDQEWGINLPSFSKIVVTKILLPRSIEK